MLNFKLLSVVTALSLGTIAAFHLKTSAVSNNNNAIGLFLVKKDQLTQQYRGEIYPIAQYKDGQYNDASVNVTPEMRDDSDETAIVQRQIANSIFRQPTTFTAINSQGKAITQFSVKNAGVGQFSCESFLVGRGEVLGSTNLKALFDQLPKDRLQTMTGFINGKKIDEVWKWTIATQKPISPAKSVSVSPAQLKQYRSDIERLGTAEIDQTKGSKALPRTVVLDDFQILDLNGDGQHEVYAKLHKALPRMVDRISANRPVVQAVYANIWLSYKDNQPRLLSKQVMPQFVPADDRGQTYDVLQTINLDRDSQSEVLVRNNGYESTSFSIYKLQNHQLKPVFAGAGYGC